jgi:hypothetical protein
MPSLRLHRDSGPQIELDRDRSMIGRDAACEVVVDDRSVSRRHAVIERRGDDWVVVDQGSANGTFIDGRRMPEAVLSNGQQLRLGSVAFRVEIEEAAPATVLMAAPELADATYMMANPEAAPPEVAPPAPRAAIPAPVVAPPPVAKPRPTPPRAPAANASFAATPPPKASAGGDDPLGLLGLGPGASAEEVRARYEELARDLQVKLAGARSPNLKSTYERNLAELQKAFHRLSHGQQAFAGELADLPSAQPMVPDLIEGSGVMKQPQPEEEEPLGEAAPAKGSSGILPGATTFLVFLAAGLFALVAFFALSAGKIEKAVKKAEEAPDLVNARQAAAKYGPAAALLKSGALRNGKLRLCNRSSRALEIDWLSTIFLQKTDLASGADRELAALASGFKLGTYNSGFCGRDFKVVLSPGAEQAIELHSEDPRCNFDGLALFYALALQRPGAPEPAESEASAKGAGRRKARGAEPAAREKQPGEPGTTFWQSGLLGGRNECVSVGAGW